MSAHMTLDELNSLDLTAFVRPDAPAQNQALIQTTLEQGVASATVQAFQGFGGVRHDGDDQFRDAMSSKVRLPEGITVS
jgi:hypothetical protein